MSHYEIIFRFYRRHCAKCVQQYLILPGGGRGGAMLMFFAVLPRCTGLKLGVEKVAGRQAGRSGG